MWAHVYRHICHGVRSYDLVTGRSGGYCQCPKHHGDAPSQYPVPLYSFSLHQPVLLTAGLLTIDTRLFRRWPYHITASEPCHSNISIWRRPRYELLYTCINIISLKSYIISCTSPCWFEIFRLHFVSCRSGLINVKCTFPR